MRVITSCSPNIILMILFPCFQPRWTVRLWWCPRWLIRTRLAPQRTCAPWRSRALTPLPMARPTQPPSMEAAPAWNYVHGAAACLTLTLGPVIQDTASPHTPRSLWNALRTGPQKTIAIWTRRTPRTTHIHVRNSGLQCTYVMSSRQPNIYQRSRLNHQHTPSLKHEWWAGSSPSPSLSPRRLSLAPPPLWPPLVELQPSALWLLLLPLPLPAGHAAPGCASVFGHPPPRHIPPLPQPRVAARPQRGHGGSEQPGGTANWHALSAPPVTPSPAPLRQEVSVTQGLYCHLNTRGVIISFMNKKNDKNQLSVWIIKSEAGLAIFLVLFFTLHSTYLCAFSVGCVDFASEETRAVWYCYYILNTLLLFDQMALWYIPPKYRGGCVTPAVTLKKRSF